MNKRPTKRDLRQELQQAMDQYLEHGGAVNEVERGASGLHGSGYQDYRSGFEKPPEPRTPVDDVLLTIDQRRQENRATPAAKAPAKPKKPKKRIIYDDFGEPLRIVWE